MDAEEKTAHQVRRLQASVRDLQNALRMASKMEFPGRPLKSTLSFGSLELHEQNPYSRLLANNDRGVLHNIERLQSAGVLIIGLNGLGALVAEAWCRYGVKTLLLADNTKISPLDLDFMQYKAQDIGRKRDEQLAMHLHAINPDVDVMATNLPIRDPVPLVNELRTMLLPVAPQPQPQPQPSTTASSSSKRPSPVRRRPQFTRQMTAVDWSSLSSVMGTNAIHVVFLCIADGDLALLLNELCCELGLRFVYVFVGPNGIAGQVISVTPGRSSCIQCFEKRKLFKTTTNSISNNEVETSATFHPHRPRNHHPASLPTTECILSGLSIQNTLMDLLGFGSFCSRLEYDGYLEEIERSGFLAPVHQCPSVFCRQQQQKHGKS